MIGGSNLLPGWDELEETKETSKYSDDAPKYIDHSLNGLKRNTEHIINDVTSTKRSENGDFQEAKILLNTVFSLESTVEFLDEVNNLIIDEASIDFKV